ncbi:MAG: hypothetical protein C4288_22355 [Leptolyngbya sp. ERB_1_1]
MTEEEDKFDRFLPEENLNKDNLFVEIPSHQPPLHPDRVPSGFEPMGEIQIRGRAFRGLANGQIGWWVLITGWVVFGCFAGLMLHLLLLSSSFTVLILLAISLIPLFILLKGTRAKLANQRRPS